MNESYIILISARLRRPQAGLFSGTVDALDTVNNTYRITFDRAGLGTHSIPDLEVRVSNFYFYINSCSLKLLKWHIIRLD